MLEYPLAALFSLIIEKFDKNFLGKPYPTSLTTLPSPKPVALLHRVVRDLYYAKSQVVYVFEDTGTRDKI
jgi:hypothetical protein